ncbi:MAG: hypothetical protein BRD55_02055 [Bacteroidetes bacterium SW_9_63_38]|nr:MAG: hypothetical protein BRD55_02055 [Bacteroidetes bacterium SW_9_63_38]
MKLGRADSLDPASTRTDDGYFRRAMFERNLEILEENALYFASDRELDRIDTFLRKKVQRATRKAVPFAFGEPSASSPDVPEYERKADIVRRAFGTETKRRSLVYIVTDAAAVPAVVEAVEQRRARDTTGLIRRIESLTERFPLSDSAQRAKLARIADLRRRLSALKPTLRAADQSAPQIDQLLQATQTTAPIPISKVPDHLRRKFATKNGDVGTFVRIYPSRTLADGRDGIRFKRLVGTITTDTGHTYHAASTSLVAADMLLPMQNEAPWMISGTFVVVSLVLLFIFRIPRWALLALTPLIVGLLWMVLVMVVLGLKLNFYNVIVLPALLGIGNDAGVHIVHRYREEGPGSLWTVLRSAGEHVTIGTLATLIGFGGLLTSFHPGLRSIGILAVVGLVTTLVQLQLVRCAIEIPQAGAWSNSKLLSPKDRLELH